MDEKNDENAEDQAMGRVSSRVWKKYFLAAGSILSLSIMVFVLIVSQVVASGSDYFVNVWTQQEYLRLNNQTTILTTHECLYIYGVLIIGVVLVSPKIKYTFELLFKNF